MSIPIRDISNVPITPRKRKGKQFDTPTTASPKRINLGLLTPENTPKKEKAATHILPDTGAKKLFPQSIYSQAKELFKRGSANSGDGHILVGRTEEALQLEQFISTNLSKGTNGSLYVSGPPGTGKTAQISKLVTHYNQRELAKVKFVNINCMVINNPQTIFHGIISRIQNKVLLTGSGNKVFGIADLVEYLSTSEQFDHLVIILDELDHLITKDQQVLFELFNLVTNSDLKTKVLIVGISNALDLTDKFLPRLKRNGISPEKLVFLPYNNQQIQLVLESKLTTLPDPIFHPMAIQLCAKKAASITGDLRKAFDICYKAIELAERDQQNSPFINQKVLISHIAKVCSTSFGNNSLARLANLNLFQKVVLCCLYKSNHDINVDAFYQAYRHIVIEKADNLVSVLKRGEFLEIVSALESLAVISLSLPKSKARSEDFGSKIVTINIPKDDLLKCIGTVGVLNKIVYN